MNNIRILTFHQCINYGAILQTFALQQYLNNNGANAEIYNYENKTFRNKYTWRRYLRKQNPLLLLYNYATIPFWIIKKRKFNSFINKNIKITKKTSMCQDEKNVDKYVVGSDQVWNIKTTGYDLNYFLDFVNEKEKKYSYAASFGVSNIRDDFIPKCKELLYSFNSISVREEQAKSIITSFLTKDVDVVLDPTLLLNKSEWEKYSAPCKKRKKYVLIYQLAYSKKMIQFAKKLAKDNGCKIITIDGNPKQPIFAQYALSAGPSEWLKLFLNADFVVTNSFHGLAFSINFNKNFYFEYLRNGLEVNSRLENLSSMFNLEERNIDNNLLNCSYLPPDYKSINLILEQQRNNSYSWIKKNLLNEGK